MEGNANVTKSHKKSSTYHRHGKHPPVFEFVVRRRKRPRLPPQTVRELLGTRRKQARRKA